MSTVTSRTLDCGMPLIVERMESVRSASLTWLVPAGTAREPEPRQGLSAMCEELIQRGAGALSSREHADALDRLGASRAVDAGVYYVSIGVTAIGRRLPEVLPLVVDMVLRPRFDADAIEPARDLCLQAIESLRDDPSQRAINAAKARHMRAPLNRPATGTREGIEALTRDEVESLWHERARPRGSILAVAGDADADALGALLDRLLSGWEGEPSALRAGPEPGRGYAHQSDPTSQVQVVVLHDAPAEREAESLPERVIDTVHSGGMSGRLFTQVREKRGLCYSVSTTYTAERDFGRVLAYVGTTPPRAQKSLEVLLRELERINAEGVEEAEFARAVVGLKSRLVFSGESSAARSAALAGDWHRLGRARSLREMTERVGRLTLEEVREYLSRRSLGRLTIQTLGPEPLTPPR